MKKSIRLWLVIMTMTLITACSSNKNWKDSETQTGLEIIEYAAGMEESDFETNTGVKNETFSERVYETDIIRYGELSGEYSFRKDMEVTRTDYAAYYFETSIDVAERNACIAATDRALSCVDAVLPEIEIVVLGPESYDGILVSGNRLYTSAESWESVDYIANILLAGYGEWSNYGMAYGYADYLCGKAEMGGEESGADDRETVLEGRESVSDGREPAEWEELEFQKMDNPEGYDLTLLCFDENFVSEEDVEAAKNNASLFAEWYLSSHTEEEFLELLTASGTSEGVVRAKEALKLFYEEHGVECSLTEIRYAYGGVSLDYAAACRYARFYLNKDWQEMYWEANETISENFLHQDYAEVKAFFECHAEQMGKYQDLFGFSHYNNDLMIIFTNRLSMPSTYNGVYYPDSHAIYLSAVMSLMHGYIHSLMYGKFDWLSLWKREGTARYLEIQYNAYYIVFYDGLGKYYGEDTHVQEVFSSLGSYLGRVPNINIDCRAIIDLSTYIWGETDPGMSYDAAASFVGYLVGQYGERDVIEYICSDDEYNAEWNKSYEELVQDWNRYIEENYSWYER